MDWLRDLGGRVDWLIAAPICVIVLVAVVLLLRKAPGPTRVAAIFWASAAIVVLVVSMVTRSHDHWGCALALLPAAMIAQHAVFLRLVRMPFRNRTDANVPPPPPPQFPVEPNLDDIGWRRFVSVFAAARQTSDSYFSPSTLAVRYGAPAVAVALVGILAFFLLFRHNQEELSDVSWQAARLGAAGSYVYVLLYLAQRNFRYDVTSGGAMWCAVVLAVGPLLACAMSHFFQPADNPVGGDGKTKLAGEAFYFVAGLAPRHVTAFIVESVRRLWVSPASSNSAAPRTIPLTQVRGITSEVADRLNEEGILDLYGLATSDPLRLIRNTNFDKRQIISWIDEAILISVLPDSWQAIEREGFTGAIDLVWLLQKFKPDDFKALAERLKLENATLLGVVNRLSEDAQLQLVWVLYHSIDSLDFQTEKQPDKMAMRLPVSAV